MKILILGGAGYIGSRLDIFLRQEKDLDIDIVDLEWFGNYTNKNNIILDFQYLTKQFYAKYEAIILLAGHSAVPMCKGNNVACFNNNVRNFVNLLPKLKNQIFIYASSSSVYGNIKHDMATEECESFIPDNAYDLSKSEIDYHAKLCDLNYYGLRFGTVNGPSPNFREDIMMNAMVSSIVKCDKFYVSAINIRRPILGISDLCRAISTILKLNNSNTRGIYNLASFNSSVGDIGSRLATVLNSTMEIKEGVSNYDFTINCDKFRKNFDFKFEQTIESIALDLKDKIPTLNASKRDISKIYE